jgi:hypothetical protein
MLATLFRGLTFNKEAITTKVEAIRQHGIVDSAEHRSSTWGITAPTADALSIEGYDFGVEIWDKESFPPFASADIRSASRYAGQSQTEGAVVLRFDVDPSQIYVDGRDFLFFSFQKVDRWIDQPSLRELMSQVFGYRILDWAERAAMEPQADASVDRKRISIACHACRDPQVTKAHLRSKIVLSGKASFCFCSAFRFNTPVPATRVTFVAPEPLWTPDDVGLSFAMLGV